MWQFLDANMLYTPTHLAEHASVMCTPSSEAKSALERLLAYLYRLPNIHFQSLATVQAWTGMW